MKSGDGEIAMSGMDMPGKGGAMKMRDTARLPADVKVGPGSTWWR